MIVPVFLTKDQILYIHHCEIESAGGAKEIRDYNGLEACVESPKVSFGGEYLNDVFGMAAAYIVCLTIRHPFVDGNKRTALASALTFLYLNGFSVNETYETELADLVLDFLSSKTDKEGIENHLKNNSIKI